MRSKIIIFAFSVILIMGLNSCEGCTSKKQNNHSHENCTGHDHGQGHSHAGGTHTHADGTVHADSDHAKPNQETFKVEADSLEVNAHSCDHADHNHKH